MALNTEKNHEITSRIVQILYRGYVYIYIYIYIHTSLIYHKGIYIYMGIRDTNGMCEYVYSAGIVKSPLMGGGFDAIFAFLLLGIFLSLFVPWSRSSYEE